jgi:acetate kinase
MDVLTINCGGSSLKGRLLTVSADHAPGRSAPVVFDATVAHVGADALIEVASAGHERSIQVDAPDHAAAAGVLLDALSDVDLLERVRGGAVGHRVVHGGHLVEPTLLDDAALATIAEADRLAPLHNEPALAAVRAVRERLGLSVPQVAVFDTAFHHDLPPRAARYAIPKGLSERHGIRRYGFHGLAHRWMSERFAARARRSVETLNLITLQLGNGCSAAAVAGGASIDTTMGMTPLEGLMMATRSGDVDPSIVGFLARAEGVPVERVEDWLNRESGLLGVSGRTRSMRTLLAPDLADDPDSALAVEMFCYRVRKCIGAYFAVLGRVDGVVFGGGIGEAAPAVRHRICTDLDRFGIVLDTTRNADAQDVEATISAEASPVLIEVLPVDEATIIGRDTVRCLSRPEDGTPSSAPA